MQDLYRRMGTMYTERIKESSSRKEAIYLGIGIFPPLIIGLQAGNAKSLVHMHRAFALFRYGIQPPPSLPLELFDFRRRNSPLTCV